LTILATLSYTNRIVFDLSGQDPQGAEITYKIVKEAVKNGGAAILLDYVDNMKNDCSRYIELQWENGYKLEPPAPFEIQKPVIKRDKK
jgi:hypothetical protein